ncbi:glutamyl-tRNA synthetase [Rhypophila decipiens]|uniref:Glutamate--tRNA ligase, mitochondrial n=1 Tax=Rhypophila decipiens TaxID=261697 RepID=A0AAN6YFX9_9PEZI|nr:glutamyl-tRNA synthetase [Rhypophila decipiens]
MRGLVLLIRRPVCQAGPKGLLHERLWFSSSARRLANPLRKQTGKITNKLPDTPCRTRFAPSPTGYLHLGSLRTALYNYLLAKATGGQFLLRIEDTDQTRLVPDAEKRLYDDLAWAGLTWDEGPDIPDGSYGPYRQSERLHIYDQHADQLIREGKAYRCFCSPEALEHHKQAAHARGEPTHYPGTCRSVSQQESDARAANGESFAVRFKSGDKPMVIQDMVYGRYQKNEREEDFIIRKRDGFPTYHFANVVDDRLMKITHVIRGAEWLISTPKHAEMYAAFGWEPPVFAHVGLLVDEKRHKLSKRDSGVDMSWYKERHILPDTLLNFALLLGWGRPSSVKSDVMTLQDMIDNFTTKFSKGDIVVSLGKLSHLQNKHLRRLLDQEPTPENLSQLEVISKPIWDTVNSVEPLSWETGFRGLLPPLQKALQDQDSSLLTSHVRDILRASKQLPDPLDPRSLREFVLQDCIPFFFRFSEWDGWDVVTLRQFSEIIEECKVCVVAVRQAHDYLNQLQAAIRKTTSSSSSRIEGGNNEWKTSPEIVEKLVKTSAPVGDKENIKLFYAVIRWALTKQHHGPSIVDVIRLIGPEETDSRLDVARACVHRFEDQFNIS